LLKLGALDPGRAFAPATQSILVIPSGLSTRRGPFRWDQAGAVEWAPYLPGRYLARFPGWSSAHRAGTLGLV